MRNKVIKTLICLALFGVAFVVPLFEYGFDVPSILTIISLFFAILVGFFIATATSNYLQLQSLIAEEDSGLIALYDYCRVIDPKSLNDISEAIDKYAIAALSFELTEYIGKTHKEFEEIGAVVDRIEFANGLGEQLIQSIHEKKNSLYQTRQNIALVSRRIVTTSHWFVLISLALLIDILLLATRDGSIFSSVVVGSLIAVNYLVLVLLRDVDNNRFLEQALAYENSQQVFMVIGKPKYYAEAVIKGRRIKEPAESYRTGYYNSFEDNSIKLVEKGL